MNNIFLLIVEFFKTGLFAVGGGLATIPFLNEMASRYHWFDADMLSTMIAVSESTPGPIGVNMATYVGYQVAGLFGALIATLSLVAPSIIVICIIANFFEKFKKSTLVQMIFKGLKPAVVAFIFIACLELFQTTLLIENSYFINIKSAILLIFLFAIQYKYKDIHPIFIILLSALIGIIFKF